MAKCRHDRLRTIYGDEINAANARSACLDCRGLWPEMAETRESVARLATLTRDLASARTALAEARGVLRECREKFGVILSIASAFVDQGDIVAARQFLARIDALAGEGGA